jgi:hypothetical protein
MTALALCSPLGVARDRWPGRSVRRALEEYDRRDRRQTCSKSQRRGGEIVTLEDIYFVSQIDGLIREARPS